jgi:hypothetical protein
VYTEKLGQVTGFFGQFPVARDKNLIKGDFLHKKQGLSLVKNPALGFIAMPEWTYTLKP